MNKNPSEILSYFLNLVNSQTFFKEFSFSKNCFITKDNTKFEFSDYILLLNGYLIIFQLKQRNEKTESIKIELKWLENKVLKKAKNQIKRSLGYLLSLDEIRVKNERDHIFNIKVPDIKEIYKVIIYLYPNNKPSIFESIKFYQSKTAGFIHILDFYSYKLICDVLYTPIEIINYLKFRESYLTLVFNAKKENEKYLLGRYLLSPKALDIEIETRGDDYSKLVDRLDERINDFDMRHIFRSMPERIFTGEKEQELDYYKIMTELALLNRLKLTSFRERFSVSLKNLETNKFNVYRFKSVNTNCGFVFFSIPKEEFKERLKLSLSITRMAKYDMEVDKSIGIAFIKENEDKILIYWVYIRYPWKYHSELTKLIKESNFFKPLKTSIDVLYKFKILDEMEN